MTEYLKNNQNGTIIYKRDGVYEENISCLTFIKRMCISHLFTYEGYKKSVSKRFNKRNLLPVVFNADLVLMPLKRTQNYDNMWINLKAIKNVTGHDKGLLITFYSNRELILDISIKFYFEQVKLANKIEFEKRKHFH